MKDEPSLWVIIGLTVFIFTLFISIMGYAWVQFSSLMPTQPTPAPTTYQTGLYVESENIQPARHMDEIR